MWVRRALVVGGALVAFALSGQAAHAAPGAAPSGSGVRVACGAVEVVMVALSPDMVFELHDDGALVWRRQVLAQDQVLQPATEGHTYRLGSPDGVVHGELEYHRPAVCDTAKLSAGVTAEPVCEPAARRVHVRNDGAEAVRVSTSGLYGNYTGFVEIAAGGDHDFVGTSSPYLVVETEDGAVPYAVLATAATGCGKFTSRLTALCGQVRWDVASDAVGAQSLAILRGAAQAPVWTGTLPAHGRLTAYARVEPGDTVLAVHAGNQNAVLSEIESFREPAACARPGQATVTYAKACDGPTATITNYGAGRAFAVKAGDETIRTVTLAPGDAATVKIPLEAGEKATVDRTFYTQPDCTPPTGKGGSGGGLPITGPPILWLALTGVLLLVTGATLRLTARNR
jgi:hypothetical protein